MENSLKTITIVIIVIVLFSNIIFTKKLLYCKTITTLTKSDINEIQYELGISEYGETINIVVNGDRKTFNRSDFITAIEREIEPEIKGLTYGILILNKLQNKNLVDALAGGAWSQNKQVDVWFNEMSKINIWAKEAQLLREEMLGEASGILGGSVLMIPNLFEAGIDVKLLHKTFNSKILWFYFQTHSPEANSDDTFKTAVEVGNFPVGGFVGLYFDAQKKLTLKGEKVKEYIESLWVEFSDGYDSTNGGLKTEFKEQYKNQLNLILLSALEKVLQEKLPLPENKKSLYQKAKDNINNAVSSIKNIPNSISDFLTSKKQQAQQAITQKTEELGKNLEKKIEKKAEEYAEKEAQEFQQEVNKYCIAEATYDSSLNPELNILRDYRNKYLSKNIMGNALVKFYYQNGPPIADFLSKHQQIRGISRKAGLEPMLKIIKITEPIWN